jgi:hypothetical protein
LKVDTEKISQVYFIEPIAQRELRSLRVEKQRKEMAYELLRNYVKLARAFFEVRREIAAKTLGRQSERM